MDNDLPSEDIFWQYVEELFDAAQRRRPASRAPPGYFPWAARHDQPRTVIDARQLLFPHRHQEYSNGYISLGPRNMNNPAELTGGFHGVDLHTQLQLQNSQTTMVAVNGLDNALQTAQERGPRGHNRGRFQKGKKFHGDHPGSKKTAPAQNGSGVESEMSALRINSPAPSPQRTRMLGMELDDEDAHGELDNMQGQNSSGSNGSAPGI
ncbi:hypothetical protein M422DRAFT_269931 [Sphaerobolus stellatus SS14]|uniref:Uncharacterized protein n=1 Tax=Sphaerobolus stellatus (strain SS14) TaxID=990650 RepID=A0A0C9TGY9_SPHS4|nr:hypothetical protein M422DRAFT_269931 [Sphaerobolus stellatus SS14]